MTNARIERMTRELNAEPATKFFENLFRLVGLVVPKPIPATQARGPAKFKLSYK
jgi:hypothetical protein